MSRPSFESRKLSFGESADAYDAYRPSYPSGALDWLFSGALRPVLEVADVGAGTGILTRRLVERGLDVVAVDPDDRMLERLGRTSTRVRLVRSSAEQIDLDDDSVDAVTVGQAFHWFDPVRAAAQLRRIVRPGGVVGVLANLRDDRVAWFRELGRVVGGADWSQANQDEVAESMVEHFPNVQRREFANPISMTPDELEQLVGTFSYVRLRDDVAEVVARVRRGLDEHPDTAGRSVIDVPYVTVVFRSVVPD